VEQAKCLRPCGVLDSLRPCVFFFSSLLFLGFLTKIYPGLSLVPLSLLETS
jgi:hypothetical protein